MRKYGLYLLIAVSLMTGCQKKDTVTVDPSVETTQESSETGSAAENEPESTAESEPGGEQNGNTAADTQADRLTPIPIAVNGEYDGEWDDATQTAIITSRCDKVYVQGDGYDALKQSLAALNKELVSQNKEEYASYKKEAEDLRKENPDLKVSYVCNYEFRPVRFDDEPTEYDTRNIMIQREQNGKTEEFTMELYGQPQGGWIVMTDDGHPYLYTEIQSENDWRTMEVFDLGGEEISHVGTSNDSPHGALLSDPDDFYLTRRVDALGTYDAYRKFHVGESGMPVAEEDVYTKVNVCDSKEEEAALVSTRELPVTMIEADGSEKEEKLPAGTEYYVRATDLESFVDMELSDGRRCRMAVKKSDKGWGFEIDGVDEENCFEFIPYAG